LKQLLLKGGDRTLNETLNQAIKMEASKAAAEPPARLQNLIGALARASYQIADGRDNQCAGSAGPPVTCAEAAGGVRVKETRNPETGKCRRENGATGFNNLNPSIYS